MSDVAIIGAGELGGALAHLLAKRNIVRTVRLVDDHGRIAAGKALDIAQAGAVERHATAIDGTTDLFAAAGASIIAIADRAGRGEWKGDEAMALVKSLLQHSPAAVVICAGGSQRELVERACADLKTPRTRMFGSAPDAMTAAARAMVGLETNRSANDVGLAVLGVPPGQMVIPWAEATIGGFSAIRLMTEPQRRRVAARLPALWPPGPYALAAAAVKAIDAMVAGSRRVATCFVAPDLTAGTRSRTAALPVRLGRAGIEEVLLPELSVLERVALENAMAL